MRVRCDYCREYYDDNLEGCPHCGAKNNFVHQTNVETPETIEQFKLWFEQHGYTSEKTRFFIGEDFKEPKAFGIYRDPENGDFVVYKNKADGSRAIRYRGIDEAYAVNELFTRFNDEVINQKNAYINKKAEQVRNGQVGTRKPNRRRNPVRSIYAVVAAFLLFSFGYTVFEEIRSPETGYYESGDNKYYHINGHDGYNKWYMWDAATETWEYFDEDDHDTYPDQAADVDSIKDDWSSFSVDQPYNVTDFSDTDYYSDWQTHEEIYESTHENDSDSDWDSDWDSGDWDSGSTDWDSDW